MNHFHSPIEATEWMADGMPAPPNVYRWDQDDSRYYGRVIDNDGTPGVVWYPSVTTVIRDTSPMPPHLLKWYADKGLDEAHAIRAAAAEYGTEFHKFAGHLMAGGNITMEYFATFDRRLQKDLQALAAWSREFNVVPLASEMLLVSDKFGVAGTVDLVCEMDYVEKSGEVTRCVAIVDYKTSSGIYRSHEIQAQMYRHMWNDMYSDTRATIDGKEIRLHASEAILWRPKDWRKAPSWEAKAVGVQDTYLEIAMMCNLWKARNPDWSPKAQIQYQFDGPFTLDTQARAVAIDPEIVILDRHEELLQSIPVGFA